MSDAMIIEGLHKLSLKLVDAMRFAEADIVDQAIARIMSIPAAATRLQHPTWDDQFKAVVDSIWRAPE